MKTFEVNFFQKKIYMTVYVNADTATQAKNIVMNKEGRVKFDSIKEV